MRRLPFFTPLALASSLLTLAVAAVVAWTTGGAPFSPGPLGARTGDGARRGGVLSHAELEGRCAACHPPPWSRETVSTRCLACHDEIRAQLAGKTGLHARLGDARPCLGCHTDHGGAEASLTHLDPKTFRHEVTGFALDGHQRTRAGQPFACADCHGRDLATFAPGRCEACHRKEEPTRMAAHVQAWGARCLACHDGVDRFGDDRAGRPRFDHAKTVLPLTGAHVPLACTRCHAGVTDLAGFRAAPERCVDCHRDDDKHAGRYGDDCARCHGATAWKPATFDHARSRFPLTGAHTRLACERCHEGGSYTRTPIACVGCHPAPADHRGTFPDECGGCHDTTTWKGARFEHRFPVSHGASRPTPCKTCHPDSLKTYTCYGCHEHTPGNVAAEHREEGIRDLSNCVRCHPTGREHEGEGGEHGEDDD